MRRLPWIAAGLVLAGVCLWLLGGPPREYFLKSECARYHEERMERFNLLRFHRASADLGAAQELDREIESMLRGTRTFTVRGWEVVLVPAGARPPGEGFSLALRHEPATPADPAPLKGGMEVWLRPEGWLARLFPR